MIGTRIRLRLMIIGLLMGLIIPSQKSTHAHSEKEGPWWPHAVWGAGDQAGASNRMTPEKLLEALKLVRTGKVYELGQVYERGMPLYGERSYSMFIPSSPTGGPFGENKMVYHDDFLCTEIGQVGTQFDGPGHIGVRIEKKDGSFEDVFYNGYSTEEMSGPYGLEKLGVENIKPYLTRGILVDVAAYKGVESLSHSYEVSVSDVLGALEKQDMDQSSIRPGDAIFFNYGWSNYWKDHEKYNTDPPGIGVEVGYWVIEREASLIGSDSWPTEVMPNPDPDLMIPVHIELITKNGIFNLENMVFDELIEDGVYEFMFVFTPIRFKGATGSPARPLGIR